MLILKDGTKFDGVSIGAEGSATGPVVLFTGVVGYQEVITDPANAGKIIVFTYPLIGNYGVSEKFNESGKAWCKGIVIKEVSRMYSNWQAGGSFEDFLKKEGVVCISGVDTRTLAVKIRDDGEQIGTASSKNIDKAGEYKRGSFLKDISVKQVTNVIKGKGAKVVVIDLGVTNSTLKQLEKMSYNVWLAPYDISSEELLKLKPAGVILSSGTEDDPELDKTVNNIKSVLGKVKMLGLCAGHLIITRALGGKVKALKIGHRGVNYPVISEDSFKGEVTAQNHGFVAEEFFLDKDVEIDERNLNDKTVEKMHSDKLKFTSIQYYPASPGMGEVNKVFNSFLSGKAMLTRN